MRSFLLLFICLALMARCATTEIPDYNAAIANCDADSSQVYIMGMDTLYQSDRSCIIGYALPEFVATTLDGRVIDRSYFTGRYTVLNFWFQTCPPCVAEIPYFNAFREAYRKKEVNFLAVCRDDGKWTKEFLEEHPWNFDHVGSGEDLLRNVFRLKWGYPTTLVTDPDAQIIAVFGAFRSPEDLRARLGSVLP